MMEWITWGKTIRELAVHLGGEIPVGTQLEIGEAKWGGHRPGEVLLFGDIAGECKTLKEDHPLGYLKRGHFLSPSDGGCGCCSSDEFHKDDIVTRYRIWPIGDS